jgi:cytidylate kinase
MPVIAMNREMGSRGRDVASLLASELGLAIVRHEVVLEHVAERMHTRRSAIQRYLEGHAGLFERLGTDDDSLTLYKQEEVLELARKGNVIIRGWGAACLLRPIPHVLCVRVGAPEKTRVRWVMQQLNIDDEDLAREQLQQSDAAHTANMQHDYGVRWGDPMIYDITLNTERLSVESCVAQIRALLQRPEFQETDESRARLANLTLEYHVRAALRTNEQTAGVKVAIEVDGGRITLRGIVVRKAESETAAALAAAVPGVQRVDNQLKTMEGSRFFPSPRM